MTKMMLLASAALLCAFTAQAGATSLTSGDLVSAPAKVTYEQVADKGRNGSDDGAGHDSNDDHGSDDNDDDSSGSGRSKARVPGGSGCDSARDIAEHAECTPGNG